METQTKCRPVGHGEKWRKRAKCQGWNSAGKSLVWGESVVRIAATTPTQIYPTVKWEEAAVTQVGSLDDEGRLIYDRVKDSSCEYTAPV